MPSFRDRDTLYLLPEDLAVPYSFELDKVTSSQPGVLPLNSVVSSIDAYVYHTVDGSNKTSEVVDSSSFSDSPDECIVTVRMNYPTTTGMGIYRLSLKITLSTPPGMVKEYQLVFNAIDRPSVNFIESLKGKMKDEPDSDTPQGRLVYPNDYVYAIVEALNIYSNFFPHKKPSDIAGDGGYTYSLPVDWDNDSSQILNIEYPIGERIPNYIYSDEYFIYDDITSKKIRFLFLSIPTGASFRVSYTITHTVSTLPNKHYDAVKNLATSLCCLKMASYYAHSTDSTIDADRVKMDKKSKEYQLQAEAFHKLYKQQVGIGVGRNDFVPPAAIDVDWDFGLSDQTYYTNYITHRKRR